MDEFDYLNEPLFTWLGRFVHTDGPPDTIDAWDALTAIEEEYLPRFEAAIWKRSASATLAQLGSDMGVDSIEEFVDTAKQFTV